jgi:hypothetical protein
MIESDESVDTVPLDQLPDRRRCEDRHLCSVKAILCKRTDDDFRPDDTWSAARIEDISTRWGCPVAGQLLFARHHARLRALDAKLELPVQVDGPRQECAAWTKGPLVCGLRVHPAVDLGSTPHFATKLEERLSQGQRCRC